MKPMIPGIVLFTLGFVCGCSPQPKAATKEPEKIESEARAEVAKQEMDSAAKTFQNRDYFKKSDSQPAPAQPVDTAPKR